MKRFWTIFLFVFCLSAVGQKKVKIPLQVFNNAQFLDGKRINSDNLIAPVSISFFDSLLLVKSEVGEYYYSILNAKTGKLINQFGSKGSAKGQLAYPTAANIDWNKKQIWVYDILKKSIQFYNIQKLLTRKRNCLDLAIELDSVRMKRICQVSDKLFLGIPECCQNSKKRFILLDKEKQCLLERTVAFPDDHFLVPCFMMESLYCTSVDFCKSGKKLVAIHRHFDQVIIYSEDLKPLIYIRGPFMIRPEFYFDEKRIALKKVQLVSNSISCGKDGFMFNIFSGKDKIQDCYEYVLWYNYEGELQKCFRLNHKIRDIDVDWENRAIYGICKVDKKSVYKYEF
ncbi:hypothetical protein EMN47_03130 [Prolixibacteraceae bacterium JC049]|nr:hypothetical protein [Prolixibacteraceae bacterium JC049]